MRTRRVITSLTLASASRPHCRASRPGAARRGAASRARSPSASWRRRSPTGSRSRRSATRSSPTRRARIPTRHSRASLKLIARRGRRDRQLRGQHHRWPRRSRGRAPAASRGTPEVAADMKAHGLRSRRPLEQPRRRVRLRRAARDQQLARQGRPRLRGIGREVRVGARGAVRLDAERARRHGRHRVELRRSHDGAAGPRRVARPRRRRARCATRASSWRRRRCGSRCKTIREAFPNGTGFYVPTDRHGRLDHAPRRALQARAQRHQAVLLVPDERAGRARPRWRRSPRARRARTS